MFIAYEHHGTIPVFQLGEPFVSLFCMHHASKSAEEVNQGLHTMPYVIGSLSVNALGGSPIQDEHGRVDSPPPQNFLVMFMPLSMLLAIPIIG
jgi:hypothetical protein